MAQKHIVIDARIRQSSTGRYVDRLLEHLQEIDGSDYKYTVLLNPKDNWQPTNADWKAIVCPYRKFTFNLLEQYTFAKFLDRLKPDLVHFTMSPQEPVLYRGRRISTTHDLTMLRYARAGKLPEIVHWARMLGYKYLLRQTHRSSKKVVVPTEFVKEDVLKLHPFTEGKLAVTYESSEPPIKTKAEKLTGLGSNFIMHVGSPFPHKNIDRLVDTFTLLKSKFPDLQLVLAGKKEYYFDKLIANKISNNEFSQDIIMPGFIKDSELKWLYQNTKCYVLPSLSEGFGLPGLEAMAHGAPVASSNATCLPEVYGDAATYFDPEDAQDMADKTERILTDSSYTDKLRTLGYKQLKRYSWSKMAQQTLEVYKQVLDA